MSNGGFSTPRTDMEWKIVVDPKVREWEMHVNPATLDRMQRHLACDLGEGISMTFKTPKQ